MLFYFLYVYARPYKSTYVNIIEMALLAYLGIFLSLSQLDELQDAFNKQLDNTTIDSCGTEVPSVSIAVILLGVVYFLPVTVLLFLLANWLFHSRMARMFRYETNDDHVCIAHSVLLRHAKCACMCVCIWTNEFSGCFC